MYNSVYFEAHEEAIELIYTFPTIGVKYNGKSQVTGGTAAHL